MKYSEAIEITDKRMVNTYSAEDKLRWLHMLDKQIFDELISQREHKTVLCACPEMHGELLVPEPYAEDVYINFLQARIAKENEEFGKYNSFIQLYNDGYNRFARRYAEKHRSLPRTSFFHI